MGYLYQIYGLRIDSELPLRTLTPESAPFEACDLSIRVGEAPAKLEAPPLFECPGLCMNAGEFLYFDEKLGLRFYVRAGREIVVDKNYAKDTDKISLYLLGSILGAVLYMRGIIPLHASAVLTEKGAVLIAGVSGAGKSTLAHALQQRGFTALTDDVAPVHVSGGEVRIYPGYGEFKLWQDSLDNSARQSQALSRVRDCFDKYYVGFREKPEMKPYPVRGIYHLVPGTDTRIRMEDVTQAAERLRIVNECVFRPFYAAGLARQKEQFFATVGLASLPMVTVTRPARFDGAFDQYVRLIEEDLRK
jgi:hypothetical protein